MNPTLLWTILQLHKLIDQGEIEWFQLPQSQDYCTFTLTRLAVKQILPNKTPTAVLDALEAIGGPFDHLDIAVKIIEMDIQERVNIHYVFLILQMLFLKDELSRIPPEIATLCSEGLMQHLDWAKARGIVPQKGEFGRVLRAVFKGKSEGFYKRVTSLIERTYNVQ